MLALPRDHLDVVVGQLAPAFLHVALELLPVSLDAIPVHFDSLASGVPPACDVGGGGFSVMASACMSRRLRILPHAVGAPAYIGTARQLVGHLVPRKPWIPAFAFCERVLAAIPIPCCAAPWCDGSVRQ